LNVWEYCCAFRWSGWFQSLPARGSLEPVPFVVLWIPETHWKSTVSPTMICTVST